jgi:hypothetical protein
MPIRWIGTQKLGKGDGSSPADCTLISDLNNQMKLAGPGGDVRLRADMGEYVITSTIQISNGGVQGADVCVTGCLPDGKWKHVTIRSDRQDPWPTDAPTAAVKVGTTLFRLASGANCTVWRCLNLERAKYTMMIGASITRLVLGAGSRKDTKVAALLPLPPRTDPGYMKRVEEVYAAAALGKTPALGPVNMRNVYRGIEIPSSVAVNGLEIFGGTWRGTGRGFLRFRGASKGLWVQDVDADCGRMPAEDGYWSTGFEINDSASDVTLLRVKSNNAWDPNKTRGYSNGDGFAAERNNTNVVLIRCEANNNSDGGIDTKGTRAALIGYKASGNRRNLRCWGWGDAHYVDLRDPTMVGRRGGNACQVWTDANTGLFRVMSGSCSQTSTDPIVFMAEGDDARLAVSKAVTITRPAGSRLTAGPVSFFDPASPPIT